MGFDRTHNNQLIMHMKKTVGFERHFQANYKKICPSYNPRQVQYKVDSFGQIMSVVQLYNVTYQRKREVFHD